MIFRFFSTPSIYQRFRFPERWDGSPEHDSGLILFALPRPGKDCMKLSQILLLFILPLLPFMVVIMFQTPESFATSARTAEMSRHP